MVIDANNFVTYPGSTEYPDSDPQYWFSLNEADAVIEMWYCPSDGRAYILRRISIAFATDGQSGTVYGVTDGRYWHGDFVKIGDAP